MDEDFCWNCQRWYYGGICRYCGMDYRKNIVRVKQNEDKK